MKKLESTLIFGSKPTPETMLLVQESLGVKDLSDMVFMVFEVDCGGKKYYCCWSGGEIVNGEPAFTVIGLAALESLMSLPLGRQDGLVFQELKLGQTPLIDKVIASFESWPEGTKICFIGDMQNELDGHMSKVFNLQPKKINVAH